MDPSNSELTTRIGSFLNYSFKQLELSYSVKAISAASVRLQANLLFGQSYPIEWWAGARQAYMVEATTRRERQFFTLVDGEYVRAKQQLEIAAGGQSPDLAMLPIGAEPSRASSRSRGPEGHHV